MKEMSLLNCKKKRLCKDLIVVYDVMGGCAEDRTRYISRCSIEQYAMDKTWNVGNLIQLFIFPPQV